MPNKLQDLVESPKEKASASVKSEFSTEKVNSSRDLHLARELKSTLARNFLLTIIAQVFNLFLLLVLASFVLLISQKKPPVLVELVSGETMQVGAQQNFERSERVMTKFVTETFTGLFTWTGLAEGQTPGQLVADPGYSDGSGRRIPSLAYQTAFALSEDFRADYLKTLAKIIPPEVFPHSAEKVTSVFQPVYVGNPEKIARGQWKVILMAKVILFTPERALTSKVIPLQKEVFVRAVEPLLLKKNYLSQEQKFLHQAKQSGLEIYGIREYKRANSL